MGIRWEKFEFADSGKLLKNPGCGFYQMKKYMLTDSEADVERFFKSYPIRDGTTFEMLEINISRYFCTELTDKAKENLSALLAVYKKAGVTLIIRILYDWDGKGKLYEPKDLDTVIWHMSQIRSVLADFPGTVYITQGVFIGRFQDAELGLHNGKVGFLCEGQRKHCSAAVVDPGVKFYQFILQIGEVVDEQNRRCIVIQHFADCFRKRFLPCNQAPEVGAKRSRHCADVFD